MSCLEAGNTPHAVFLVGPAGSGKKEYARQAASLYLLGREDGALQCLCLSAGETLKGKLTEPWKS